MSRKIQTIIAILIVIIISSTLCIESDKKDEEPQKPEGVWNDLTLFEEFLVNNVLVTFKEEPGSSMIISIDNPEKGLYVAVGIDEPFTNLEAEALYNFVEDGGNIIIASDNSSNVNPLAKKFGLEYSSHTILDKGFDYNYTFIPLDAETDINLLPIIVQAPLGLEIPETNVRVLARSNEKQDTIHSVLDINDNNQIDGEDIPGPIPIIVEITVGDGKAIFISDAGMFTDNLWNLVSIYGSEENPEFIDRAYQNFEYIAELIFNRHSFDGTFIYDKSKQTAGRANFRPYPLEKPD